MQNGGGKFLGRGRVPWGMGVCLDLSGFSLCLRHPRPPRAPGYPPTGLEGPRGPGPPAAVIEFVIMSEKLVNWLRTLDLREVVYPLAVTAILFAVALWRGGARNIRRLISRKRGVLHYKAALRKTCQSLIVIGRREGFSLEQVYIPLDLAASDLSQPSKLSSDDRWPLHESYVLVAGPGAGKSTYVKKAVLDRLGVGGPIPFFVRLREFDPQRSILAFLADQLRSYGIPDPEEVVEKNLKAFGAMCVLDGLDEVRPHLARAVCDRINSFYHDVAAGSPRRLIVTCRKEAYRDLPLDIGDIREVRPLTDEQIDRFARKWPLAFPAGKSVETFMADLESSPQIFELTRSPLLLVGGLMQYTESNLGIPQERVQYLARIAQWLVADWAIAQGHHADPYRPLYPRILSRLAFQMHIDETAEYPVETAIKLIETWVPHYGVDSREAREVFRGLLARTGMLVRDLPHLIVFSQFGMQEYYASTNLLSSDRGADLANIANKVWWREAILLGIAQQNEPTHYIEILFPLNGLLAAESVAESPTPSLTLQQRALEFCVRGIDEGAPAAVRATISLLRRVKGVQEQALVRDLEERLGREGTAKDAGTVLAMAGTASATACLARHPGIWETCLQSTGFLSDSLEKLLVMWIRDGDEPQSRHATDLLADRLSSDRFTELVRLLPDLPGAKASYLAVMLLRHAARRGPDEIGMRNSGRTIREIAACAARLPERIESRAILGEGDWYHSYSVYVPGLVPAIGLRTALTGLDARQIEKKVDGTRKWFFESGALCCWIGAGVALAAIGTTRSWIADLLSSCFVLLGVLQPTFYPVPLSLSLNRWRMRRPDGSPQLAFAVLVFILGASCQRAVLARLDVTGHRGITSAFSVALASIFIGFLLYGREIFHRQRDKPLNSYAGRIAVVLGVLAITCADASFWLSPAALVVRRACACLCLSLLFVHAFRIHCDLRMTLRCVGTLEKGERDIN